LSATPYELAREYFAELGETTDDIVSVIEFGTQRAAGLSDIDIMVVVESEHALSLRPSWVEYASYPERVRHALDGGAIKIVTEEQFIELPLLGSMNVGLITGSQLPQIRPDENDQRLIDFADVMDWLAERIVTLTAHVRSPDIHATRAINCAYSITHTFNRAAAAGVVDHALAIEFRNRVDVYRTEWRNSPESAESQLVETLVGFLAETLNLATRVARFAESEGHYSAPADAEKSSFRFNNGNLRFATNPENLSQNSEITVPSIWFAHLIAQSQMGGLIPVEIAARIQHTPNHPEVHVSHNLYNLLENRIRLSNSIAGMLDSLGMRDNIYRFGHLLSRSK
jgi:hypothetical protein